MKNIPIMQAKLKYKVEDFIVEEIGEKWICEISKEFKPNTKSQIPNTSDSEAVRNFLWCELEKKDIDHFTAIKELSIRLNKKPFDIGYAGTKDKRAITSQRISILFN